MRFQDRPRPWMAEAELPWTALLRVREAHIPAPERERSDTECCYSTWHYAQSEKLWRGNLCRPGPVV